MSSIRDKKEFHDLNFQVWRIRDERREKWRDEVYIMGDDSALQVLRDSLQGLFDIFQTYGKGTRKYACNPPSDFDHVLYEEKYKVKIQWLDSLVVRLGPDPSDNESFILEDHTITLNVNPNTLKQFIKRTQMLLDSRHRYMHGADAVCGLRFSPDWLGIELSSFN